MTDEKFQKLVLYALLTILGCQQIIIESVSRGVIPELLTESAKDAANKIADYLKDMKEATDER